ncbi:BTB/POZ domain-containing protein 19 [Protopterus annectens]|uniref:BTB/POZ domain-containing protein 19 n=1 Tax=Protopterus annectens TaxID=7888 RepID=UPI001CF9AB05|nr:BTB/POZ domain-containing protein 19 [Protopterus annectens]
MGGVPRFVFRNDKSFKEILEKGFPSTAILCWENDSVLPKIWLAFIFEAVVCEASVTRDDEKTGGNYMMIKLRGGCQLCVQFICETLVVELACEALQAAVTYGQVDMKKKCLAFIEGSTREVVKTRGFHELSDVAMIEILHSDSLMIDEFELIRAVREWAHVNSVVLDKSVPEISKEVVKELRLALLSPEELTSLENDNKKENFIPVERIAETWKFHALKKGSGAPFHLFKRRIGTLSRDHHKYLDLYYK